MGHTGGVPCGRLNEGRPQVRQVCGGDIDGKSLRRAIHGEELARGASWWRESYMGSNWACPWPGRGVGELAVPRVERGAGTVGPELIWPVGWSNWGRALYARREAEPNESGQVAQARGWSKGGDWSDFWVVTRRITRTYPCGADIALLFAEPTLGPGKTQLPPRLGSAGHQATVGEERTLCPSTALNEYLDLAPGTAGVLCGAQGEPVTGRRPERSGGLGQHGVLLRLRLGPKSCCACGGAIGRSRTGCITCGT